MIGENWKFEHVGLIVRDNAAATAHYQRFGFEVTEGPFTNPAKSADNPRQCIVTWVRKDELYMEIMQPLEGRWVAKDFLEQIGEGLNHICFRVDDIEAEKKRMEEAGFPVVYGWTVSVGTFAYFDTRAIGNVCIELLQLHPGIASPGRRPQPARA